MRRSPLHQTLVYLLLVCGAVAFAFPFVWMFSSSVKADREQFSQELKILPMTPRPQRVSPYVDASFYDAATDGGDWPRVRPAVERLVLASGFAIPANVDRDAAVAQLTLGVGRRLHQRFTEEAWNGPVDALAARMAPLVDASLVASVYADVYRFLAVGPVRVRGNDVALRELAADRAPSSRWTLSSPIVRSVDIEDAGKKAARLDYDFAGGDRFSLAGTFALPIDASELRRVQIDLHPDDTWHDLTLTAEHSGRKYVAHRDVSLANFDWATFTWQHASADDVSTKLRTWVVFDDVGSSDVTAPRELRLTIDVRRASQATAWANKLKLNYLRTNQQIPFFRYVRVSLFLVAANIALTLLSSSLVAYAFARITWPGRDLCFVLMLATMMIPAQVTMIPNFLIWTGLGAYNTLSPLWVGAAFGNAFFIFMLRQFMAGIPRDLEDAARIDGCGFLRIYWHVVVPLIKPSLAAIAVMTFIGSWNDFMGPLIYLADQRLYPLAFGLYAFSVQVTNNPALSMAGSVLMTLPIIAIFFAAQRYFIQGITLTGMKG